MKFALINVHSQNGKIVHGSWLQNHIGTLETATKIARDTEKVNSNRITVAVVAELTTPVPMISGPYADLIRLD